MAALNDNNIIEVDWNSGPACRAQSHGLDLPKTLIKTANPARVLSGVGLTSSITLQQGPKR
jgi:hypothetical protein